MMVMRPGSPVTVAQAQDILDRWVRPAARGHGGDVRVVEVSPDGEVLVEFAGACLCCPLQAVTFGTAVQPAFDGAAGVREVRCNSVRVSPHALRRIREMMRQEAR
jgi:Fe-S cluster biogenesis protein NfuA